MRHSPGQQTPRHRAIRVAVKAGPCRPVTLYPDVAHGNLNRGSRIRRLCPDDVPLESDDPLDCDNLWMEGAPVIFVFITVEKAVRACEEGEGGGDFRLT